MRRRILLFALLALAVPVPAFAISLGFPGTLAGSGTLDAHAALDNCGTFQNQIVCKIDVAFNSVDGANRYSASVIAPDGSVDDYGTVGVGGGSLWVPYVGDGTYTVQVDAWGEPKSDQHAAPLVSEKTSAGGGRKVGHARASAKRGSALGRAGALGRSGGAAGNGTGAGSGNTPPTCEQPPTPPSGTGTTGTTGPSGDTSSTDQSGANGSAATLGGSNAAPLEAQGQVPNSVTPPDCPDGTVPAPDGTCCQPPAGQ